MLFPPFNITVDKHEVIAIYSSLNIRNALLQMFIGKSPISGGTIQVNEHDLFTNKAMYFSQIGILLLDDGVYERLTVKDHFKFYKGLYQADQTIDQILKLTQLEGKKHRKVKQLSKSEQKRLLFAKLLFQDPALFVFEEPDLNVDVETKRVFLNITNKLQKQGKGIVILTGNMESALTAADTVYRLDENGLTPMDIGVEEDEEERHSPEEDKIQAVRFHKIPAKLNEKIVLFNPPEVDYIESSEGQSNLHINGEAFPTIFTLNELEDRLLDAGFFRCHRSYIVNLQKVREIITWTRNSYSLILDDKQKSTIPLSKTKMAQLKGMLGLR